ncbi:MAG: hypothetical protein ACSHYF_06440 [Verrucomicrobiaceae bacterium]
MMNIPFKTLALAAVLGFTPISSIYADDTPLAEQMEELSGSLKRLRRAETVQEKVDLIHAAQAAVIKGLEYLPASFKDIKDAKELAKSTAGYKQMTGQSYVLLCQLELAVLAEDEAQYDEVMDKLKDAKKEGHKAYKAEE